MDIPNGLCSSMEPSVSGPQLAVKLLRESQVVEIVGCPCLNWVANFSALARKPGGWVQFKPRAKQACNHPSAVLHSQISTHHPSVKDIGNLKVRGDAGYVLGIP